MRALIVGVDSRIGGALALALRARGDSVIGTSRRVEKGGERGDVILDLGNPAGSAVPLPPAEIAYFCAAMARFDDCRGNPALAEQINVAVPVALARRLAGQGSRVVLLSTSAVFDCSEPFMSADRPRAPRSVYGRLKATAETAFLAMGRCATVLRLTKVLTPEMALIRDWIGSLARGAPVRAFNDLRISPLALGHVLSALLAIASDREGGIFQISGSGDVSYAEVARHLTRRLGISEMLVESCAAIASGIPAEEVTAFTSLDVTRMERLCGFRPPDPGEVIEEVFGPAILAALQSAERTA